MTKDIRRPVGLTVLSAFLVFGFTMASLAAVSLLWPGGPLDPMWRLNPTAKTGLTEIGGWGVVLMLVTATACAITAFGLWTRARWGRQLAIALIALNLVSDVLNALVRGEWTTLIGVPIAGVVIWYLLRPQIRDEFEPRST